MIACRRFKSRNTGENILHEYEGIISNFDFNNATHMIEAFNFGIPGFASSVVKDNEEDLSSLTVMLKTVSQKRLCSQFTVGDKRCV